MQVSLLLHLPLQGGVPVVFDGVICPETRTQELLEVHLSLCQPVCLWSLYLSVVYVPARQQLGDVCPTVSQQSVGLTDDVVLLQRPATLLHCRVQMVVPALAALLPITTVQVLGDERPALHTVLVNQIDDLRRK